MVDELEDLLPEFSQVNHTRCFLHVNNLIAQTIIRQFDTPKPPKNNRDESMFDPDDADCGLYEFAANIDYEEQKTREKLLQDLADGEELPEDDNVEGWADEMAALSIGERQAIETSLKPVKLILVKVSTSHRD